MSFDASELANLGVELGDVSRKAGKVAAVAVRKTAKDIEKTAKQLAPVDTGFLRGGIGTSDLRSTTENNPEAEVRATANYAVYQELGTSRMAAQPFMRPAADKHEPAFLKAMEHIIDL